MNIEKLNGIIDAVEMESKMPSPSHNNLARLCAMFMRESIKEEPVITFSQSSGPATSTTYTTPSVVPEVKKRRGKSK